MRYLVLILVGAGLLLHVKIAFIDASVPLSVFNLGLLLWHVVPYLLIVALRKYRYASLSAVVLVFSLDWVMYLNVVYSGSSTAAISFLFTPLWNIVLVIPLSLFVGNFLGKIIEK